MSPCSKTAGDVCISDVFERLAGVDIQVVEPENDISALPSPSGSRHLSGFFLFFGGLAHFSLWLYHAEWLRSDVESYPHQIGEMRANVPSA